MTAVSWAMLIEPATLSTASGITSRKRHRESIALILMRRSMKCLYWLEAQSPGTVSQSKPSRKGYFPFKGTVFNYNKSS